MDTLIAIGLNILLVAAVIGMVFGCSLGDYAEGCCGMPGADYANEKDREKDMFIATCLSLPSAIILIAGIIISFKCNIPTLLTVLFPPLH